jgi:hypothetical protein
LNVLAALEILHKEAEKTPPNIPELLVSENLNPQIFKIPNARKFSVLKDNT